MYTKERIGHYTWKYSLNPEKIKTMKDRNFVYQNILAESIETLFMEHQQSIVINEKKSGGFIIGNIEYINEALKKLRLSNNNTEVLVVNKIVGKCYCKIGFRIREKPKNGFVI